MPAALMEPAVRERLLQHILKESRQTGHHIVAFALHSAGVRYCAGTSEHLAALPTVSWIQPGGVSHTYRCVQGQLDSQRFCTTVAAGYGAIGLSQASKSPVCLVARTGPETTDALPAIVSKHHSQRFPDSVCSTRPVDRAHRCLCSP